MAKKGQPQDVLLVGSLLDFEGVKGLRRAAGKWILPGDVRLISAASGPKAPSLEGLVVGAVHIDPRVWTSGLLIQLWASEMVEWLAERTT